MSEHVYKIVEVAGSSPKGFEDAVQNAIQETSQSVRQMRWFEVTDTRGHLDNGAIAHWQVTLKIGFTTESGQ